MELNYGKYQLAVDEKKELLFYNIKRYLNVKDIITVERAYEVANYAHFSQVRKSGEPYITHPIEVATIISKWRLDGATIAASLLHDVVEDTSVTKADLIQIFGNEISNLVDSVTKLEKINFESEEVAHAEYFRKVVLAMAQDVRVIIIKLADRLHNILTLSSMKQEKRCKIALETMEIYVPIANRIGLHRIHLELADESFKYLHPFRYRVLEKAVNIVRKERFPIIEKILTNIDNSLKSNAIQAKFIYRQRAIYNLYRRMKLRHQDFNRIYDIFEIKIIVATIRECYLTLGVLHSIYQPLPSRFKDYIAIPKNNGYQSLHSTLMGPHGIPIQLHIRTNLMEKIAENGIINYWLNNKDNIENFSNQQNWINNILDIQSSSFSANEFLDSIKQDLSPDDIYVFTPKGKIVLLPSNSTALDFAYFIHTDIGNHCSQVRVNQKFVKINTSLSNGDVVEVITSKKAFPTIEWLDMAFSTKAISKIKQYIKEHENVVTGFDITQLVLDITQTNITINEKLLQELINTHYPSFSIQELKHCVNIGTISVLNITKNILKLKPDEPLVIKLSNCNNLPIIADTCMPIPGMKLYAVFKRNGQLTIHRSNCRQNKANGLDNSTLVHIINDINRVFLTKMQILMNNSIGNFSKFAAIVSRQGINIEGLSQENYNNESVLIKINLGLNNLTQLDKLVAKLKITTFIEKFFLL